MSLVSVSRKNEPQLMYRRIEIFLNGKSVGYFPEGKNKEFDLPAGQHKMKAKTRWFGSREMDFTVFNKEKKSIEISTNTLVVKILAVSALIDCFLFILTRGDYSNDNRIIFWIKTVGGCTFALLALYYFTIGRNSYLSIKETKS